MVNNNTLQILGSKKCKCFVIFVMCLQDRKKNCWMNGGGVGPNSTYNYYCFKIANLKTIIINGYA